MLISYKCIRCYSKRAKYYKYTVVVVKMDTRIRLKDYKGDHLTFGVMNLISLFKRKFAECDALYRKSKFIKL